MDIWEIASVIRAFADKSDTWVDQLSALTSTNPTDVLVAYRYYMAYQDKIDAWIRRNNEHAESSEAAWRRAQAALVHGESHAGLILISNRSFPRHDPRLQLTRN